MKELEECILKLNESILALHDRLSAVEKVCEEVIKRDKYLQDKFTTERPKDNSDEMFLVKQENLASFENFKGFKK